MRTNIQVEKRYCYIKITFCSNVVSHLTFFCFLKIFRFSIWNETDLGELKATVQVSSSLSCYEQFFKVFYTAFMWWQFGTVFFLQSVKNNVGIWIQIGIDAALGSVNYNSNNKGEGGKMSSPRHRHVDISVRKCVKSNSTIWLFFNAVENVNFNVI